MAYGDDMFGGAGGYQQAGIWRPFDVYNLMQTSFLHTGRLTHGFGGKTFNGWRDIGNMAVGMTPDANAMRKLSGQTITSRLYGGWSNKSSHWRRGLSERIPGLGRLAPSLSHLGPARAMTSWAALSGDAGAMSSMRVISQMEEGINTIMQASGSSYGKASWAYTHKMTEAGKWKGLSPFDYNAARSTGMFEASVPGTGFTWGRVAAGEEGAEKLRGALSAIEEAANAHRAGTLTGEMVSNASNLYNEAAGAKGWQAAWNRFMVKNVGIKGNKALGGMGKIVGPTSRVAGSIGVGMMIYQGTTWAGGQLGKATFGAMETPGKIYNAATASLHRGMFMSSGPISPFVGATQRQRAMANIYDKQLNLRQVMGNEAPFLMASWG